MKRRTFLQSVLGILASCYCPAVLKPVFEEPEIMETELADMAWGVDFPYGSFFETEDGIWVYNGLWHKIAHKACLEYTGSLLDGFEQVE